MPVWLMFHLTRQSITSHWTFTVNGHVKRYLKNDLTHGTGDRFQSSLIEV